MLKRSKISLMAFISVSLVIIILISLYPDFFVNADGTGLDLTNTLNIDDSFLTSESLNISSSCLYSDSSTEAIDSYSSLVSNNIYFDNIYTNPVSTYISSNNCDKYVSFFDQSSGYGSIAFCPCNDSCFVVINRSYFRVYLSFSSGGSSSDRYSFTIVIVLIYFDFDYFFLIL